MVESEGVNNFMAQFVDGGSPSIHKKNRGRPKRVEVSYDDLKKCKNLEEQLIYPAGHGLSYTQLVLEEDLSNNIVE